MGSLRDGLLKAGLVSKKQTAHQERTKRSKRKKRKRGRQADPEELRRQRVAKERADEAAAQEAARVAAERARQAAHELRVQVRNLIHRPSGGDPRRGQRGFHFVTRAMRIGRVWVTGAVGGLLERGRAGIAEDPFGGDDRYHVLERATIERIIAIDGTWVRFYNGHPDYAGLPPYEELSAAPPEESG